MNSYLNIGIPLALLLLILIAIFNWKAMRLFIVRMFYGSYSLQYVSKFKKIYIMDNPFPVCIDDDLISHFSNFADIDPKKTFHTKSAISFNSISFSSKFSSIKGKGEPERFNIYQFSEEYTVKIMGYAGVILGNPIRELYFMANDIFVMGEYVFTNVSKSNNKKLTEMLAIKYAISEPIMDEMFFIRNDNDSAICYANTGITISIQYINLNNPFVDEILHSHSQRGNLNVVAHTTPEEDKQDLSKL